MALPTLQGDSGQRLSDSLITGMTRSFTRARYQLFHTTLNPNGAGYVNVPRHDLSGPNAIYGAKRRLMSLTAGADGNFTHSLNTGLQGGTSYPILEFALATGTGLISGGAGLLFSVATLGLSLSRTAQRVLARGGDEIWQVEQIGLVNGETVHVGGYFLFDPYRNNGFSGGNGWLIHEERHTLDT
ncbi:MAG: hypothetical protein AAFN94_11630 [Pseudomonadota bacterium]